MLNLNFWDIAFTVINLLVFFLLLKIFLFKPVLNMMDRREQMIKDDLDSAKAAKEEIEQLKKQHEAELSQAHKEAVNITAAAKKRAEHESAEIIAEAHSEADSIIAEAHEAIKRDKAEAVEEARGQIADLAVLAASRVISKNLDEESNRKFAEQLLSEVGAD